MKKIIPIIVAVLLIGVVAIISVKTGLLSKYSYSMERADASQYFSITKEDEVAIIYENALNENKARLVEGIYYIPYDMLIAEFNPRFYYDQYENNLLYTTPTQIITAPVESKEYQIADASGGLEAGSEEYKIARRMNDKLYVAIDYVKKYTNLSCVTYSQPNRMILKNQWGNRKTAQIDKDTHVRKLGGVKSPILTDAPAGKTIEILEKMDDWSKVITDDGYIGYVENKRLTNEGDTIDIAVTDYEEPVYTNITKDYTINMVWHQVMSAAANDTLDNMVGVTKGVTTISPTWFSLKNNNGDLVDIGSSAYVQKAHQMGMEVWAMIDNVNYPQDANTFEILSYTSKRMKIIQYLMDAADRYGLDGINVDFENLSGESGVHFIQFIRELSIFCRANGLVLSVDNYVPKVYTGHYDRAEQGTVADYVIIMGYDEHHGSSKESGSVASLPFVREGIENTVTEVPAEKVINALPLYTRVWKETPKTEEELAMEDENEEYNPNKVTSEAVGMSTAEDFLRNRNVTPVWDETTSQNYGEVSEDGVTYKVWLEDEQSIGAKLDVMKEFNIAGVASWKLGLEKAAIWEVIASYVEGGGR